MLTTAIPGKGLYNYNRPIVWRTQYDRLSQQQLLSFWFVLFMQVQSLSA